MTTTATTPTTPTTTRTLTADVCLYGTSKVGHGWIAAHAGGSHGNGEILAGRSMTEAIWLAVDELRGRGVTTGMVAIHAPGGERFAVVDIAGHVPAAGDLVWLSTLAGWTRGR